MFISRSKVGSALVCLHLALFSSGLLHGQEQTERSVVVSGEQEEGEHDQFTEMGEYTQPAWAERSRLSSTTSVYVLSPYELFAGSVWEAVFTRHGKTLHDLTQELDFGLPHRLELGIENELGLIGSDAHETAASFETRYAFANWNKIPLNPAISVSYILGIGKSVEDASTDKDVHRQGDAVAVRLLFGQNFGDHFGYGLNLGFQQDVSHDSGSEFEISQSVSYGAMKGKSEFGAEMRYAHVSEGDRNELVIGPTIGWKPTRQLRISVAPLIGCTHDSPHVTNFVLVSYEFGGAESIVTPVSGSH